MIDDAALFTFSPSFNGGSSARRRRRYEQKLEPPIDRTSSTTNLLQIVIPATINSLVCQKGQFTLQLCPRRWFVRKIFGYYTQKVKIEKSS